MKFADQLQPNKKMTAYQTAIAAEVAAERRARNPIIASKIFGTRQDELAGRGAIVTCTAREDGRFLIQLRVGGSLPFQKFYPTKEDARKGWKHAVSLIK